MAVVRSIRNEEFLHQIQTPGLEKTAQEKLNAVVRLMVRDGAIDRTVLIPEYITYSDLDRQQDTDVLAKIIDVEPNSPGALVSGFGTTPPQIWVSAPRVRATFWRIQSNIANYDIELLGPAQMVYEGRLLPDVAEKWIRST